MSVSLVKLTAAPAVVTPATREERAETIRCTRTAARYTTLKRAHLAGRADGAAALALYWRHAPTAAARVIAFV